MKNHYSIPECNTQLKQITAVITEFIDTRAIYCFSATNISVSNTNTFQWGEETTTSKTHFFLLVLTEENKHNATADLADLVAGTIPNCKATVLLHKTTSIRQLTSSQKWFFSKIIKPDNEVVINCNFPTFMHHDEDPVRKPEMAEIYWNNRLRIAKTYLDSEKQIDASGIDCVQYSMLHVAVEQICLGLIEVVLGYHPNHYALAYLFSLCSLFTKLPEEIFPRNTAEDEILYKHLTTNFHTLRHAKTNYHGYTYTELLSKRCSEFIERA